MEDTKMLNYLKNVLANMPADWLNLTTHRLDIYNESLAKTEFLEQFENMYNSNNADATALANLPTAFDYIRLGHPLSSVLEWAIANMYQLKADHVISFSSKSTPILAVLRKNLMEHKNTRINYTGDLAAIFDADVVKKVYGYQFETKQVNAAADVEDFDGTNLFVSSQSKMGKAELQSNIDFYVSIYEGLGSIILVNGAKNSNYISEIQHVRRRETIAMTPANCLKALQMSVGQATDSHSFDLAGDKQKVLNSIKEITTANTKAMVGSSGLSIQYAIAMGLVDYALEHYPGKDIKFVVPPNCYGGTNDQARRVAACLDNVEVMDLPVDGGNDMVQSVEIVLEQIAKMDAVPYIIAEIPTNPRVEVPDLHKLAAALGKERKTQNGATAVDPVFILDQTFCPNVHFLGADDILAGTRTISYVSGSKFPSGGKCTAGYCVANDKAKDLMDKIELHLQLCDNEATALQMEILAAQMPSMNQRIADAYKNTREFVNFISQTLPDAKINFVSEELANEGFTPSVFSLDLPTKGNTDEERETYKRELNNHLINLMINEIPTESKYCVSYGQLKGCYWTIPATSTQGTTKEGDKDYIARVALSPKMDLEKHKAVFAEFVEKYI
ncbi:PLP-dependent transferase [Paracrocinitomix mangrovi]|uniref:PLP-dependent transferase n=1 Tax=Paracrocinitomix mangrovi TaxID=2862509 RepID=UPI001C8DACBB|nr:PLP-dependent transferase [Paracrocinitomix mangrovi]UKN03889.1 PLP-dependent transferase [Paracrocinitomix mangrovi]